MGQNISSRRSQGDLLSGVRNINKLIQGEQQRPRLQTQRDPHPFLDFVALWMGGTRIPDMVPLPLDGDEFLDWTEDASVMTQLLHEQLPCSLYTVAAATTTATTKEREDDDDDDNEESETVLNDQQASSSSPRNTVCFKPYVLASAAEQVKLLSSMAWIERCSILSNNVFVTVQEKKSILYILSALDFCRYHFLLCRLVDLLTLRLETSKSSSSSSLPSSSLSSQSLCTICCSETESTVLQCGHTLCSECEKRWVQSHLICPFCRHRYRNIQQVQQSGWQLTEWNKNDLDSDVDTLEYKIREFWDMQQHQEQKVTDISNGNDKMYERQQKEEKGASILDECVTMKRQIRSMHSSEDFLVVTQ